MISYLPRKSSLRRKKARPEHAAHSGAAPQPEAHSNSALPSYMGDEPALRLDAGGGPDRESEPVPNENGESSEAEQSAVPPIVNEVLRSPGQPLGPAARDFAETHLGDDFSQ